MDQIDLYRVFCRVAETHSFTRAADSLRMPRSSVSTAIAQLETRLGAKFLHRTTRTVTLTHEGEELYDRCRSLISQSEELDLMFHNATRQVEGRVRVDVPGRIGRKIIIPALPKLLERYPGIMVEIGVSDRPVDLITERVDCALRVGALEDSGLRTRRIGEFTQINVASPSYIARYGFPDKTDDLDRHYQVAYASPASGRVEDWEWLDGVQNHTRPVPWQVSANSGEGYIACALAGLGMIQIPAFDVANHLETGELIEILPHARPAALPMSLLFPGSSDATRRLQVFADWLQDLMIRTTGFRR